MPGTVLGHGVLSQFIMTFGNWSVSLSPWEKGEWGFLSCCWGGDGRSECLVRSCREGRSPTVSVCILPLRLLKSLLLIQHKDLATNFPFCELCAPPTYRSFFVCFCFSYTTIQGSDFSKTHSEVPFFLWLWCADDGALPVLANGSCKGDWGRRVRDKWLKSSRTAELP